MDYNFANEPGMIQTRANITCEVTPLISIITPYYNAAKHFEQTYLSVINQTFQWFEWIIINDGSTDDISMIQELEQTDSRIRIIHQENQGQAVARNTGIYCSAAEIIVPLDADDLIISTYLEVIYWGLKQNPAASWCYTDSVGFGNETYVWVKSFSASRIKYNNFMVCTAGIRKSVLKEVGGYDAVNNHYDEDWKLWLDLLGHGKFPVHLNIIGFWYRRTQEGMKNQVRHNYTWKLESEKIIKKAAEQVDESISAIEYPVSGITNRFLPPIVSDWIVPYDGEKKTKHILMMFPWLEMGGADLFNLKLIEKLDRSQYSITVITTLASHNTWKQKFESYADDIFTLPDFLDKSDYPEFISYIIKTRKTDIIFLSNSYYGYYLLPWIKKEFPAIAICDYVHMEEWYWRRGGYARTSGVWDCITDMTYVCNERTRKVLINIFGRKPEHIKTIYIGVDSKLYNADLVPSGQLYQMFSIKSNRPIILFPCRIHPQKRPFLMIEIAKELKNRGLDLAFVVVGDGPQLAEMTNRVSDLKLDQLIYFAGRQDDMLKFYRDAAITLICSLKEGLALTAYESMAMNTPVITSDVGGQAELVDNTVGHVIPLYQEESEALDNRMFDQQEIMAYSDAIEDILSDSKQYKKMSLMCREKITKQFSSDLMVQNLEHEFEILSSECRIYQRNSEAGKLLELSSLIDELCTIYTEFELLEDFAKNINHPLDTKNELMRIANTKWGQRIIHIAFRLKVNRWFR